MKPCIYVRVESLGDDVVDDDLRTVFQVFGEVTGVRVLQDKKCGFVEYRHRVDAEKASHWLDGILIKDSFIRVYLVSESPPVTSH